MPNHPSEIQNEENAIKLLKQIKKIDEAQKEIQERNPDWYII